MGSEKKERDHIRFLAKELEMRLGDIPRRTEGEVYIHHQPICFPGRNGPWVSEASTPIFLMTTDAEILNRIFVNRIQEHVEKGTPCDQVGSS